MRQRSSSPLAVACCLAAAALAVSACGTSAPAASTGRPSTTTSEGYPSTTVARPGTTAVPPSTTVARPGTTAVPPSTTLAGTSTSPCGRRAKPPSYRHIIWILEENNSFGNIYRSPSAPYINAMARKCGIASNDHNITHDSLPNYLGLTDGATLPVLLPFTGDCWPSASCELGTDSLFNQLSSSDGWKAFDESMPASCDRVGLGDYAPKHNPAVYYTDLRGCPEDDVALGTLSSSPLLRDLARESTAPAFSFVTPNMCDDMHGAPGCASNLVLAGDAWLSQWLARIISTTVYKSGNTAVFIVWDEGDGGFAGENCATNTTDPSCTVPLIVIAPSVRPGTVDAAFLDHYSLLKATEDLLGLPELGLARSAASLTAAFNL
jgi:phosphatidylinositol-3-phosphatase